MLRKLIRLEIKKQLSERTVPLATMDQKYEFGKSLTALARIYKDSRRTGKVDTSALLEPLGKLTQLAMIMRNLRT